MTSDAPTVLAFGRFVIERELGRGEFGIVYRARDRRRGSSVALKLFENVDATSIARLEQEFALLSKVRHPNLVQLYEIVDDEDMSFITMELVDGPDLVSFVRADLAQKPESRRPKRTLPMAFGEPLTEPGTSSFLPPSAEGLSRLESALPQLVSAVEALHSAGIVHRDLRPANVRITFPNRVVVLDYGLATNANQHELAGSELIGTASYMAPEQWDQRAAGPASDWYAVGVLLFEALTGALPFSGSAHEVFVRKRTVSAPRPSLLCDGLPEYLDQLAVELLDNDTERRPRGRALLERLAAAR